MNQASLELWRKRIDNRKASGLKVADWCGENNLSTHAYYYWRKRIETVEGDSLETTEVPVFTELKPTLKPMDETKEQLQISWKDFQISISTAGSARFAAEFIGRLRELC